MKSRYHDGESRESALAHSLQRRHLIALALAAGCFGPAIAAPSADKHHSPNAKSSNPGPILVLGDSLSAEYGLTRGKGWVGLLQQRVQAEKPAYKVVNASISGETTAGGKSRLPALLAQHQPSVLILELGGNDALRGLALQSTQSNLLAMVQAAKQAKARVLLVGMQVPPNYGSAYTEQFATLFETLAKQEKLALVPFLLAGIGDAADAEQWFQRDRIHPNAKAQPQMLGNVWPQLKPLLS